MDKIVVNGGVKLAGKVRISGAKNAALPILAATLLSEGKTVLRGIPRLRDVDTMLAILRSLGTKIVWDKKGELIIDSRNLSSNVAPYELVSTMRASVCVLGPLLARCGRAKVAHPGGCVIGLRPIDLHLKGLRALGARIDIEHGYIVARSRKRLVGGDVYLGGSFGSTVLGTANVMMAATLAEGETMIENAACEPEIVDLACFLAKMGAKISGAGTHLIRIKGVKKLSGASHRVIPDRIEGGTYLIAGAITGGEVFVENCKYGYLQAAVDKLREAGVKVERKGAGLVVAAKRGYLKAVDVTTFPFPGFPTDMQAQIMALMLTARGISVITEKVYPDRFMHASELLRMGASIIREGPRVIVKGGVCLSGAQVMASDLRASAALILAGLTAEGKTEISRIYHLDRGYERIDEKLRKLGARIERIKE